MESLICIMYIPYIAYLVLLSFLTVTVLFLLVLAIAGRAGRADDTDESIPRLFRKIGVLIPAHKEDAVLVDSVLTNLKQDYPADRFS